MTFEETLVSVLESGSACNCYPLEKPEGVALPVAVYERFSTGRNRIQGVKSTYNTVRMALRVYGTTYSSVKSTVGVIKGLLDENTTDFTFSRLENQADFKDPETGLYYEYLEYILDGHFE